MAAITWDDLTFSLALHLESMPDDATFVLYVDESDDPDHDPLFDSGRLYVQFCAYDAKWVRCEVVSNHYLPDGLRHTLDDLVFMDRDGWNLPEDERIPDDGHGSPNIWLDIRTVDSDRAAAMVVRVFQHVWNVSNPNRLVTDRSHLRGRHAFRVFDAPADYRSVDPSH